MYIELIAIALSISFVGQLTSLTQELLADERGTWALAPGWQREISFWNLGVAAGMGISLHQNSPELMLTFTIVAVVITLLFGLNHLISWGKDNVPVWHVLLGILNLTGTVLGIIVLVWNHSQVPL